MVSEIKRLVKNRDFFHTPFYITTLEENGCDYFRAVFTTEPDPLPDMDVGPFLSASLYVSKRGAY